MSVSPSCLTWFIGRTDLATQATSQQHLGSYGIKRISTTKARCDTGYLEYTALLRYTGGGWRGTCREIYSWIESEVFVRGTQGEASLLSRSIACPQRDRTTPSQFRSQ